MDGATRQEAKDSIVLVLKDARIGNKLCQGFLLICGIVVEMSHYVRCHSIRCVGPERSAWIRK